MAFRFASAITSDPKDRAMAQEQVARDYAARGAFSEAIAAAERIEGWRRGVAFAVVAADLVAASRADEARVLLARSERERAAAEDWQGARIEVHIATTLAVLGDLERAEALAARLATNDRQYGGRAEVVAAAALARRRQPQAALEKLAALDGDADMDVAWSRTEGYLEVAREAGKDPTWRDRALDAARRSADGLPGWKRGEALVLVAREMHRAGRTGAARDALRSATDIAQALPPTMPIRARLLAELGRGWAETGRVREARLSLRDAERTIPETSVIDGPALYAAVASARAAIGDRDAADRLYDRALTAAEDLRNARPRALAAVEICRALGREDGALDEAKRSRLERLLGGLGDPW
jgi:tetratricopeptide (TPR) repeat protein